MPSELTYARVSRRLKALCADICVLIAWLFVAGGILRVLDVGSDTIATILFAALIVSLDPFLVSLTGGTIGHHLLGIRVQRADNGRNISLLAAYLRVALKLPLGMISLLSMLSTQRHQALHDLACGSVAVLTRPAGLPTWERETERLLDTETYEYPSAVRRFLVVVAYLPLVFLPEVAANAWVDRCWVYVSGCSPMQTIAILTANTLFWVLLFFVVKLGAAGQLFGARRRLRS